LVPTLYNGTNLTGSIIITIPKLDSSTIKLNKNNI
jgi:hypothetical protein